MVGHAEHMRAASEVAEGLGVEAALGNQPGARTRGQIKARRLGGVRVGTMPLAGGKLAGSESVPDPADDRGTQHNDDEGDIQKKDGHKRQRRQRPQ